MQRNSLALQRVLSERDQVHLEYPVQSSELDSEVFILSFYSEYSSANEELVCKSSLPFPPNLPMVHIRQLIHTLPYRSLGQIIFALTLDRNRMMLKQELREKNDQHTTETECLYDQLNVMRTEKRRVFRG